jgi:hypothetical protein
LTSVQANDNQSSAKKSQSAPTGAKKSNPPRKENPLMKKLNWRIIVCAILIVVLLCAAFGFVRMLIFLSCGEVDLDRTTALW